MYFTCKVSPVDLSEHCLCHLSCTYGFDSHSMYANSLVTLVFISQTLHKQRQVNTSCGLGQMHLDSIPAQFTFCDEPNQYVGSMSAQFIFCDEPNQYVGSMSAQFTFCDEPNQYVGSMSAQFKFCDEPNQYVRSMSAQFTV